MNVRATTIEQSNNDRVRAIEQSIEHSSDEQSSDEQLNIQVTSVLHGWDHVEYRTRPALHYIFGGDAAGGDAAGH